MITLSGPPRKLQFLPPDQRLQGNPAFRVCTFSHPFRSVPCLAAGAGSYSCPLALAFHKPEGNLWFHDRRALSWTVKFPKARITSMKSFKCNRNGQWAQCVHWIWELGGHWWPWLEQRSQIGVGWGMNESRGNGNHEWGLLSQDLAWYLRVGGGRRWMQVKLRYRENKYRHFPCNLLRLFMLLNWQSLRKYTHTFQFSPKYPLFPKQKTFSALCPSLTFRKKMQFLFFFSFFWLPNH